jgi:hypothetical protein
MSDGGFKYPRAPPNALKTGPVATACAVAVAYYTYRIFFSAPPDSPARASAASDTKKATWWRPSN